MSELVEVVENIISVAGEREASAFIKPSMFIFPAWLIYKLKETYEKVVGKDV